MAAAFGVLLLATLFQGSFGICFKKYQPFSWEAFWALFSIIGVLGMPHIWSLIAIGPDYLSYVLSVDPALLAGGALAGFFWGISSIWYSRAIDYIGVSLVSGINLGLSNLLGSLVPMVILGTFPGMEKFLLIILGQVVLMVGVVILSRAGFMKSAESGADSSEEGGSKKGSLFMVGFIMALASGAGSAALNIGSSATVAPVEVATAAGVPAIWSTLLQWVVVMFGGFIANFFYALYKLVKNKTFSDYTKPGCGKAYAKVLLTAFVWFAALGVYGFATNMLGTLGPVVGWIMFNGLALIVANAWGFRDGEWKGFPRARNMALVGNAVIVVALVILGVINGM